MNENTRQSQYTVYTSSIMQSLKDQSLSILFSCRESYTISHSQLSVSNSHASQLAFSVTISISALYLIVVKTTLYKDLVKL